ncbi:MAG: pyridoxine 5'-phosphate synthase [Myxococcales bacterium]|nr:pyridoxine 5'-phosphate synthase [Myxococcales bacterium]
MRALTLALDALPSLRDATAAGDVDVAAAAALAELAGVDAVRLSVNDDLKPVREEDVREARRAARRLELRMPPSPSLLKVALEARPDVVVLAGEGRDGRSPSRPLDLKGRGTSLAPVVRGLAEAGIPVTAVVAPDLDSVKRVHAEGLAGVELFTGTIVDLPAAERSREFEQLGDAVRLAAKLRMVVGVGGGLGYRTLPELIRAAPAAERVVVGRAALARAVLVGLDRALRDLRELLG